MTDLVLFLLNTFGKVYSQNFSDNNIQLKRHKFSINLLITPALYYEMSVAKQTSLKFGLGYTPIIGKEGDKIGTASFFPTFCRIYYENKDSKLSYNSGSYYGLKAKVTLDASDVEGNIFTPD